MTVDKPTPIEYAFKTVLQAIRFYHVSPVRLKPLNILEPDSQRGSVVTHGVAAEDKHAIVHLSVRNVMQRGSAPREWKIAFALRHLVPFEKQHHWDDIAQKLGRSPSSVRRWVGELEEDVGCELVKFGVLDPEVLEEMRKR